MTGRPITPTRVIPAGEPLPAPAAPPPPPPPPFPPATAAPAHGPDWWRHRPGPPPPPAPVPVDVHVTVTIDAGGPPEPPPDPPWWRRIRWGYHAVMATMAFPLSGPWARVLADVREHTSLAGTWVIAVIPLAIVAWWDNAARIQARHADPDLWAPRIRATAARLALYATAEATVLTLPLYSLVIALTGVRP